MTMANSNPMSGGSPGNITGIVELEIDQVDVRPDYALHAVAIEAAQRYNGNNPMTP